MHEDYISETAGYWHFAGCCDNLWNSNAASAWDATNLFVSSLASAVPVRSGRRGGLSGPSSPGSLYRQWLKWLHEPRPWRQ